MITLVLIFVSTVLLVWGYMKWMEHVKKTHNIPAPPAVPILGHALMFWGNPRRIFKTLSELRLQYPRLIGLWLGPWINILLFDPKDVEIVLKSSRKMEKAYQYKFLRPWLGDSILLSNGAKFKQNKKILTQALSVNNLKSYVNVFNYHALNMTEKLKSEVGKEFDITQYLSLCTMHTLLEGTLGVEKDLLGEEALKYSKGVEKVGRVVQLRAAKVWLYPDFIFNYSSLKREQDFHLKILNDLTNRVIAERKKEFEANGLGDEMKRPIFVDNFFAARKDNGEPFSQEEIKDEVMTMMFAGQDTTTVSIGFVLSLLGRYEEVQDRVVAELDDLLGDSNRYITYEDCQKLKYLEMVIQETWRLFPPIPLVAKKANEDIHLENCVLPKNCSVGIIIMMLHRNASIYPKPFKFNPDNFLPEKIKERHPCSFIPFSAGYRTCIGPRYAMLLIKVVISCLLRKYKVKSNWRMVDFGLVGQTTLRRKEGFLISLSPRERRARG